MLSRNKWLYIGLSFLILALLLSGSVAAQDSTATGGEDLGFNVSPLNPAFLDYLERREDGEMDLSEEGFPLGYVPPPIERYRGEPVEDGSSELLSLPASFDLRTTGRVTPVKDQGSIGSCWTFATYGSLESYLKTPTTHDFSENNLMRLHGFDNAPNDGGHEMMSMAYLARWSGPVREIDDPYPNDPPNNTALPVFHIQQVKYILETDAAVKQAVYDNGAIYTAFYWNAADFNSAANSYYYSGSIAFEANHAVAIVGWNDNYNKNNFNTQPPGDGAWIIKNSWGTSWGDSGYFYMSYYDTYAKAWPTAFHNAESVSKYDRNYQYDYLGWVSSWGSGSNTNYGANIFTAQGSGNLTAVSTYAVTPNTAYEIKIYTGVNAGQPISGALRQTQTGTLSQSGYHTIPLNNSVSLTSGQRFSVVIKYTTPGFNWPTPAEFAVPNYSSAASANAGESFISADGTTWKDVTTETKPAWATANASICIKAFSEQVTITPSLAASFTSGTWWYTYPTTWDRISTSSAHAIAHVDMTGDGKLNLVTSFNSGTWYINASGNWVRLSTTPARAMVGLGPILVASFPSGTWAYYYGSWERLSTSTAQAIAIADINSDGYLNIVCSFPSGTWWIDWSQASVGLEDSLTDLGLFSELEWAWVRLSTTPARAMVGLGPILVASFPSGTWAYYYGSWSSLSKSTAQAITITDVNKDGYLNIVCSFPSGTWWIDWSQASVGLEDSLTDLGLFSELEWVWVRLSTSTARAMGIRY